MAFIDPTIAHATVLAQGVKAGTEVHLLDPGQDGVEQMMTQLADRPDLSAVHVFCHGTPGQLHLGTARLNAATLEHYARRPNWSAAFAGIDLFLYGCNLAQGTTGKAFLEVLQRLSRAKIAASSTPVGSREHSGNWELDVRLGEIQPAAVLQPEVMATYAGVLAVVTVTSAADSGTGSLRAAIASAAAGDTIAFAANLANQTIALRSQLEIPVGKNLIIDGAGATGLTLSGSGSTRILKLNSTSATPTSLTVKNLILANGYTPDRGGAITTTHQGRLTVESVTFTNNIADKGGGAVYSDFEGSLSVTGSAFRNNRAIAGNDERGAGAIAFFGPGTLTVRTSEFTGNKGINGAAINSLNGRVTIENSQFRNNDVSAATVATGQPIPTLRGYGGAIYTDRVNNTLTITGSVFEGNTSRAAGGAVHLFADPEDEVTIANSVFRQNRATGLPGGEAGTAGAITHVRNSLGSGSLLIQNTSVVENTANGQGGGLWVNNTRTQIRNSTFSGNTLVAQGANDFNSVGGAMTLYSPTMIENTTIANNRAGWSGGGIGAANGAQVTLKNSILLNNTANNPWQIQNHTSQVLTDGGGNLQFPPKATNLGNDFNATSAITIADPKLGPLQQSNGLWVHPLLVGSPALTAGVGGTASGASSPTTPVPPIVPTLGSLQISDGTISEGNSGSKAANLAVTLSTASAQVVTVNYATVNGTATAGSDYTTTQGTLRFNPGETVKTIPVTILSDTIVEPNETFTINLTAPTNATLSDSVGSFTIVNDDLSTPPAPRLPTLSVNNVSLNEGNRGSKTAVFTVRLAESSQQRISVDYATANGTATAGRDYTTTRGTLRFNPGETSKTVKVTIAGDTQVEANETFFLRLSKATNARIATSQATGTIVNDDGSGARARLTTTNVGVASDRGSNRASVSATVAAPMSQSRTIANQTANLPASAGKDYAAMSGSLRFQPGETGKTIGIPVRGDTRAEGNEPFAVKLKAARDGIFQLCQSIVTIQNDDGKLTQPNAGATSGFFACDPAQTDLLSAKRSTRAAIAINPQRSIDAIP
jgi:predicted outer membrane repeat protein